MSDSATFEYFNITCPQGGRRYLCDGEETEFVGCCNTNACSNAGVCPDDALRYTSFNGSTYADLPKLSCGDSGKNTSALWYTCAFTSPAFMGCCNVNPCALDQGCPEDQLAPARLTTSTANRDKFLNPDGAEASATASSSPDSGHALSTGAIVGIAVGGAVAVTIISCLLGWILVFKPRKQKRERELRRQQEDEQRQHMQQAQLHHPTSPAPGYPSTPLTQNSPYGSPVPVYPSGVSSDGFNKLSPYQQSHSDRPVSTNFSDVSSVYGRPQYHHQQGYAPAPMVPVQEMDASAVAAPPPQELGTGQEHGIVQHHGVVQEQEQVQGQQQVPSPLSRGNTGFAQ